MKTKCSKNVKHLKNDYLKIIIHIEKLPWSKTEANQICSSYNEKYGLWTNEQNSLIYEEIHNIGIVKIDKLENINNPFYKLTRKFHNENTKYNLKKLVLYYYKDWIDPIDTKNIKNKYLTIKENLTIEQYLKFIVKITKPKWFFFTIKKSFMEDNFEFFYFNENEYDKYLKELEYYKKLKILYEMEKE